MKVRVRHMLRSMLMALMGVSASAESVPVLDQFSGSPPFNMFAEFHDGIQTG
jgi:hypothetical protein